MKVVAIVQARMGSTRLPNKVMKMIVGRPMIELLLRRLKKSKEVDQIVLATSVDKKNDPLVAHVESLNVHCYRGSEQDVLSRYYLAAKELSADVVVRITGDCPFVDAAIVDKMIQQFKASGADYCSNTSPPTFPNGLDVEVFKFSALERANTEAISNFDREHVTPFLRDTKLFKNINVENDKDLSNRRWTVDEAVDLDLAVAVYEHFAPDMFFGWKEILKLEKSKPEIFNPSMGIKRNEGAEIGTGQKLWKRAKQVIPGGGMLLSKRAEMFLPDRWPSYFSKAKGCTVWDLDGTPFTDMFLMGVGTNTLGYGHPEVDDAVRETITAGNMSTLNCPEEVFLADKLIDLHPWADMARFTRSGGEANAVAIRIARAASGRSKVAFCGYHGWHDWYLSANLSDGTNLAGHLLPGLDPNGVPDDLRGTVLPFSYNNYQELETLVTAHDIGVIKMEVVRNKGPVDNFLHKVRQLATDKNIVLIFDECTSGFRESFGGLHKNYGVEPDMAVFGKTLGNGYAINAVIGRREVMQAAQTTFISSTFWTERIGPTAALKTLEVMEREKSWVRITATGLDIRKRWQKLADQHGLKIDFWGLPALSGFSFASNNNLKYKTLITQEMLAKNFLAGNSVYTCIDHTPDIVDGYFHNLEPIFALIADCEAGRDIDSLLKGPVCHAGFKRLN
jgi:glutamate-1-semialdehyde 2,1-aminomutase